MHTVFKYFTGLVILFIISGISSMAIIYARTTSQHNKIIFSAYFSPVKVDNLKDGLVSVGFLQSARPFTLDSDLPKFTKYKQLLLLALKEDLLLKIYVFENSTKIAKVQKAPMRMIIRYRKSIIKN